MITERGKASEQTKGIPQIRDFEPVAPNFMKP
jgi:hypothetical protein